MHHLKGHMNRLASTPLVKLKQSRHKLAEFNKTEEGNAISGFGTLYSTYVFVGDAVKRLEKIGNDPENKARAEKIIHDLKLQLDLSPENQKIINDLKFRYIQYKYRSGGTRRRRRRRSRQH